MHYIVLDLEWNQSAEASGSDPRMPFEIIEIGAVKLNEQFDIIEEYSDIIRPFLYKTMVSTVKEMLGYDEKFLENGKTFPKSVRDFLAWCGKEYRFCTFGDSDLVQLQRNLDYYKLPKLEKPLKYYDIQKIYSNIVRTREIKSLETVVMELGIEHSEVFHRAVNDARYTALVMQKIDRRIFLKHGSFDYYNNPKNKREEIHKIYDNYYEFISREFNSKTELLADREVKQCECFYCSMVPIRKLHWFASSQTVYYCLYKCRIHGYLLGKIKIKTTLEGKFFAVKTVTGVDEMAARNIKKRYEDIRARKREKRKRTRPK